MVKGLTVQVEDRAIVIRVPIDVLPLAFEVGPGTEVFGGSDGTPAKITDVALFADALFVALTEEVDETGVTRVEKMLDEAMVHAVEFGAEGVELPDADIEAEGE